MEDKSLNSGFMSVHLTLIKNFCHSEPDLVVHNLPKLLMYLTQSNGLTLSIKKSCMIRRQSVIFNEITMTIIYAKDFCYFVHVVVKALVKCKFK